ncbi:MAG TPA: CpsB/CapC family capsule biosynthesis tyrosine phosphatase [Salinimicrobium sp.]|nr:CpsB/CapC family capsule biosynthesis tyrosine phosphatase [Salinimicrobium sp.]
MFSFFQSKKFLIDALQDYVDIHNHILPGIDDGAKDLNDSLNIIKGLSDLGITNFIATPHIMNDYYGNNNQSIETAFSLLKEQLEKEGRNISLRYAAEYMMDPKFELLLKEKNLLSLSRNYVLMEMSYFQAPLNLDEVIFETFTKGYLPVLAHPERYVFFHPKFHRYTKIKSKGVFFQLNALSLTDHYGPSTRKAALKLLESGMIDFLATDTHHVQHIEQLKEVRVSEKHLKLLIPIIESTKGTFLTA